MKKKTEKTKEPIELQYFTPNGVNVTDRIKDGRTTLMLDLEAAEKVKSDKKSYLYPVTDSDGKFIGYGIPK
jgi:hypothetical protein